MFMSRLSSNITRLVRLSVSTVRQQQQHQSLSYLTGRTTPSALLVSQMSKQTPIACCYASSIPRSSAELREFLQYEIQLEKKAQRSSLPQLKDWSIEENGAVLVFTRKFENETVKLTANVNNAVDAVGPPEETEEAEKHNGEMICKPDFSVEITKDGEILGINCSMNDMDEEEEEEGVKREEEEEMDLFSINEISIFKEDFGDADYVVSGDVMDGNMYDLMMNLLEERGINDKFIKSFTEYCTVYEHGQYVKTLEKLDAFLSKK